MKIVSVVGARPQFVKLFPITNAIPNGVDHQIVHTGQHYDEAMSQIFFDELAIPRPQFNLDIGSGSHAVQTAQMMIGLEASLLKLKPDVVLVYGDTNSTIAAALVTAKLNIPLAHLEAGLRSFNRTMPEEVNRIVTDHLSDLLFAPSQIAMANLRIEGLEQKSFLVGDVMVDAVLMAKSMIQDDTSMTNPNSGEYIYCTIHRAENTDNVERLRMLVAQIRKSPLKIVLSAHPRLLAKCELAGVRLEGTNIEVIAPQSYLKSISLITNASGVITDSGGMQKEAYILGIPLLTIRNETEWPETLVDSANVLDPSGDLVSTDWTRRAFRMQDDLYGDGAAAHLVIEALIKHFNK